MPEYRPGETWVIVMNVCPSTTLREVHEAAGGIRFRRGEDPNSPAFRDELPWDSFRISLDPGQEERIPENFANQIEKSIKDKGWALIRPGDDENAKAIWALQEATRHYESVGPIGVAKLMSRHGYKEDDLPRVRNSHAGYFLNEVKFHLLNAELERRNEIDYAKQAAAPEPDEDDDTEPIAAEAAPAPTRKKKATKKKRKAGPPTEKQLAARKAAGDRLRAMHAAKREAAQASA